MSSSSRGLPGTSLLPDEHDVAAALLANDPKYKKYEHQIDKSLSAFENVHDWADCTAFLTKLLKTLQAFVQFKDVPRKLIVSKRLAQCLNPALPTGVHQKALDVYSHILTVLGVDGLKRDLSVWSIGLLPFFDYAATSLKSTILQLYEAHYLPLGSSIRPLLRAFILALFPGLEEETSEHFDKVLGLLDRIKDIASPLSFFQNIWLIMLSTPSARGSALNFLAKRLPNFKTDEDITNLTGRDVGLMIRAFASVLEDDNLLVRRSALDILVVSIPMNSFTMKRAKYEDCIVLMACAAKVVLRRDLSLNRRLFAWLLGSSEGSDQQIAYLRSNSLSLLSDSLRQEMLAQHNKTDPRPWKIFLSLLDKWEIGSPLTENLIYDSFRAMEMATRNATTQDSEVFLAASDLYQAVQPWAMWSQIFRALYLNTMQEKHETEGFRVFTFILSKFGAQEQEAQQVHLPVIFSALAEFLEVQVCRETVDVSFLREALILLTSLAKNIASDMLGKSARINSDKVIDQSTNYLTQACILYGIDIQEKYSEDHGRLSTVFSVGLGLSLALCRLCTSESGEPNHIRIGFDELYRDGLTLAVTILGRLPSNCKHTLEPDCKSEFLLKLLMEPMNQLAFTDVKLTLDLCILANQKLNLDGMFLFDNREAMRCMFITLLGFLRRNLAPVHISAVAYIWQIQEYAPSDLLETVLAQMLSKPASSGKFADACDRFGVLWRYIDDNSTYRSELKMPLFHILGTLRHDVPAIREVGECWMRTYPTSYLPIMDCLLFDLISHPQKSKLVSYEANGRAVPVLLYESITDQRWFGHLLELLLALVRFGGSPLSKSLHSSTLEMSAHPRLLSQAQTCKLAHQGSTYLDLLVDFLTRIIQSEPSEPLKSRMKAFNDIVHSLAIDILQFMVARSEFEAAVLGQLEAHIVGKLYYAVHSKRPELQGKLLHLLHFIIYAAAAPSRGQPTGRADANIQPGLLEDQSTFSGSSESLFQLIPSPLLLQTLQEGIDSSFMGPQFQYWLDFVLVTIPLYQSQSPQSLLSLIECVCGQIGRALTELNTLWGSKILKKEVESSVNDLDVVMLLNVLERLVTILVTRIPRDSEMQEALSSVGSVKVASNSDSGSLLGLVSNVFGADTSQIGTEYRGVDLSPAAKAVRETTFILYRTWVSTAAHVSAESAFQDSLAFVSNRGWTRCRKALERIFRLKPADVFVSLIDRWHAEQSDTPANVIYDVIDLLASSSQEIVQLAIDVIQHQLVVGRDKALEHRQPDRHRALFGFLEGYLTRLEPPIVVQVWNQFYALAKDVLANMQANRGLVLPMLRCAVIIGEKMVQVSAAEAKKVRRDYQDVLTRLLESSASISGKAWDQSTRLRRPTKDALSNSGRGSPVSRGDGPTNEKNTLEDMAYSSQADDLSNQINFYLARTVLPSLHSILPESDKVSSACTNIVYYIISPAIRAKSGLFFDISNSVMEILQQITKVPGATKSWRGVVQEAFSDNRFFEMSPHIARYWSPVISALESTDKQAFPELVARVSTNPSGSLFSTRETEILSRTANLRRVSYALLTNGSNQILSHLPAIQEQLVEALRGGVSLVVQGEVYLCMRVLLCRLSAHNISGMWPVIITNLLQILHRNISSPPSNDPDELKLLLSACKFLDLALTLQTPEFQIHQWMFITDTVDAIYSPCEWRAEALLDRLAEVANKLSETQDDMKGNPLVDIMKESQTLRRPLLSTVVSINKVSDLGPFFSHVSLACYETLYASRGEVDWEAVEASLLRDVFIGRTP